MSLDIKKKVKKVKKLTKKQEERVINAFVSAVKGQELPYLTEEELAHGLELSRDRNPEIFKIFRKQMMELMLTRSDDEQIKLDIRRTGSYDVPRASKDLSLNVVPPEEVQKIREAVGIRNLLSTKRGHREIIKRMISGDIEDNWQAHMIPVPYLNKMISFLNKENPTIVFFALESLFELHLKGFDLKNGVLFVADTKLEKVIAQRVYGVESIIFSKNDDFKSRFKQISEKANQKFSEDSTMPHFGKKFNVLANFPYQEEQGRSSAKPIYPLFIEETIKSLKPHKMISIHPSRWMVCGKGLDHFRETMLKDKRVKEIISYNEKVFVNVEIQGGVQILLWEQEHDGDCLLNGKAVKLNQFDVVISNENSRNTLNKIINQHFNFLSGKVSSTTPYGIISSHDDFEDTSSDNNLACYFRGKEVRYLNKKYVKGVNFKSIPQYKVCIGKANGGANKDGADGKRRVFGKPFIAGPNEILSQSYIFLNSFDDLIVAQNFVLYAETKFFRYMLGLRATTQDVSREKFAWVPDLSDYTKIYTDEMLYKMFDLNEDEISHIESTIREF